LKKALSKGRLEKEDTSGSYERTKATGKIHRKYPGIGKGGKPGKFESRSS